MRGIGRFLTALTLILALLLGAAGDGSAHALMADHHAAPAPPHETPCDHHDRHAASSDEDGGAPQEHQMPMTAACCSGVMAPAREEVVRTVILRRIAWHPATAQVPATRLIAPDPRPPKSLL